MANTFNLGNGNWAQKTEKLLAYNAENDNFKPLPFDFDRGSTATRVNKDGLIETVGTDEPRIDFLNNTKGHLLLEPSRTNLVPYSEDFSQWTNTGSETTDTAEAAISPDGSLNATKLQEANSSFGYHRLSQSITASSGTDYALSFFAKKVTQKYVQLLLINTSNSEAASKVFDLENGTLGETIINGSATLQDAKIEDFGNGWYRCTIIAQLSTAPNTVRINLANAATENTTNFGMVQYTGDGNGNIYMWGAQVEAGSYATSYIPTSGSAVTRSVDTIEQSGFQGKVMNATQGTIFIHFNNPIEDGDNNDFHMFRSEGTSGIENGFLFRLNTGTGVDILERVLNATGAQFGNIVVKGQENKIAISFTSSTLLGSGNGVTKSYAGTYLGTKINIDEFQNSGATLQGFDIIDMKFYDTALTQEEINALTS
jgi:hypothetical protein